MPSIILPIHPQPSGADPRFLDFGTNQDGGFAQDGPRIHRLGNRWALDVTMPTQWLEPHRGWGEGGRVFLSRLRRALQDGGAIYPWPQLGLKVGAPGAAPLIAADINPNIDAIPVSGFRPHYVFREGQFFNIINEGRHFLHSTSEEVMVGADGTALIPIHPRTRWDFGAGDAIRMDPVIEGRVQGNELAWTLAATKQVPIQFSIVEFGSEGLD